MPSSSYPLEFPRLNIDESTYINKWRPSKACNMTFQPASLSFKRVTMPDHFINEENIIDDYAKKDDGQI